MRSLPDPPIAASAPMPGPMEVRNVGAAHDRLAASPQARHVTSRHVTSRNAMSRQPGRGLAGAGVRQLTPRQTAIITFILRYRQEHGFSPTYREIGEAVGISSPNSVTEQMRRLAEKGAIKYEPGGGRTCIPTPLLLMRYEGRVA